MSEVMSNSSTRDKMELPKINGGKVEKVASTAKPTKAQLRYLKQGLDQAGGKLPLFDKQGQQIPAKTIQSCVTNGWAEPWFNNPTKPDWLVCKLTELGRQVSK